LNPIAALEDARPKPGNPPDGQEKQSARRLIGFISLFGTMEIDLRRRDLFWIVLLNICPNTHV
jgi:hypothetical protein